MFHMQLKRIHFSECMRLLCIITGPELDHTLLITYTSYQFEHKFSIIFYKSVEFLLDNYKIIYQTFLATQTGPHQSAYPLVFIRQFT